MPDNSGVFVDLFTFSRARVADYTDASGQVQTAPVDTPRLDHNGAGQVLGLRIEGRDTTSKPDLAGLTATSTADLPVGRATVLHDYIRPDGAREMVALYTYDAVALVKARLSLCGWHRRLAVFPGHLERSDLPAGPVRFGGETWSMTPLVLIDDATALSIDGDPQTVLIEA